MNTAAIVLKGALCKVLKFPLNRSTVAVNFSDSSSSSNSGNSNNGDDSNIVKGKITVRISRDEAPSSAEIDCIVEEVNSKIVENCPVHSFVMSREEAESIYGDVMYDKYEVSVIFYYPFLPPASCNMLL